MLENSENRKKLKDLKIFEKVAFEFKDGWSNLVYQLGKDIQELCELTKCELPMIQQIKEKMGTLRFYYDTNKFNYPKIVEKSIRALVDKAVLKSANICEECGKWAELRVDKGYWFVSCDEHKRNSITAEEWKELDKKQREALENEQINKKPYKPLKFGEIKSPILKRKIMEKAWKMDKNLEKILECIEDIDFILNQKIEDKILKPAIKMNIVRIAEQFKKFNNDYEIEILKNFKNEDLKIMSDVCNNCDLDDISAKNIIKNHLPNIKTTIVKMKESGN